MGCEQSTPVVETNSRRPSTVATTTKGVGSTERLVSRAMRLAHTEPTPPKLDTDGNLVPEEVVKRTVSSITNETFMAGKPSAGVQIEYAYWTQRGYYPDDPHKENQDEYSIDLGFAGEETGAMFAVYDGHGTGGHDCARFAKRKLPQAIAKHLRQARVKKYQTYLKENNVKAPAFEPKKWPYLAAEEYKACCRKGFLECNEAMHKSKEVEDKLSGTTAITVSLHGNLLTVANVGDSRALLGHAVVEDTCNGGEEKTEIAADPAQTGEDERILAIPLSRDQTPYRKDERERVKKKGAAVMSIDQMEGREEMHENWGDMVLGQDVDIHGDPPRVWMDGKDYPGTAFTRSLGDYLAEGIGVEAEPEMLSRELTSNDRLLVVASDGVFEFLTNQDVVDMCLAAGSPLLACEAIVKAAYKQWLIYENRTDDITIIVCFLKVENPPPTDGSEGTTEDLVGLAKTMYGNKPVRKKPRGNADNLSVTLPPDAILKPVVGILHDGQPAEAPANGAHH